MRDMCTEFPGSSYQEGSAVTSPPQSDGTGRGVRISGCRGSPSIVYLIDFPGIFILNSLGPQTSIDIIVYIEGIATKKSLG